MHFLNLYLGSIVFTDSHIYSFFVSSFHTYWLRWHIVLQNPDCCTFSSPLWVLQPYSILPSQGDPALILNPLLQRIHFSTGIFLSKYLVLKKALTTASAIALILLTAALCSSITIFVSRFQSAMFIMPHKSLKRWVSFIPVLKIWENHDKTLPLQVVARFPGVMTSPVSDQDTAFLHP